MGLGEVVPDKQRLLICNWRYVGHPESGGAEVWTQRVAEGLCERGFEVTVFTAAVKGLPRNDWHHGVRIIRRGSRVSLYWHARRFLKSAEEQFDFVIDEVNTRPFFAQRFTQLPVVTVFHQLAEEIWRYEAPFPLNLFGRRFFEVRWLRKFEYSKVVAVSQSTKQSLKAHGIKNVQVIQNGSDHQSTLEISKPIEPSVCFLGRLVASKRPEDAIVAFLKLQQKFPTATLNVIGTGPLLQELAAKYGHVVRFTGYLPEHDRNAILQSSHILIVTSVREGWGLNVTEASTFGTLTIAYDVPGLRDSVTETDGILVEEDPDSLAQAMITYFSAEVRRKPLPYVRTWDQVCLEIDELLRTASSHL